MDLPKPALIGVIHLPPLPGAPRARLSIAQIVERARTDARILQQAGFDAAIVENIGDVPLPPTALPPAGVAAMALVAKAICDDTKLVIGINVLRNDASAALGIASAVGASFIRVNVHIGVAATDQGLISGRADETLRYRQQLGASIAILADVDVKHAASLSHTDIAQAARDTAYRGLADGLIVTGKETGRPADYDDLRRVRDAVPDRPLYVGSGATAETIGDLLTLADGVIVGSGIKLEADVTRPIDAGLARDFARAAGRG